MSQPLAIYLHDHLAGSTFAIHLLKSLSEQYPGEPLGTFSSELVLEIEADQSLLKDLVDQVGSAELDLKQAVAWLAEKLSYFKLHRDAHDQLGTFEALETLALGIHGKLCLWHALALLADADARLRGLDYDGLIQRAKRQQDRVEAHRLQLATVIFRP